MDYLFLIKVFFNPKYLWEIVGGKTETLTINFIFYFYYSNLVENKKKIDVLCWRKNKIKSIINFNHNSSDELYILYQLNFNDQNFCLLFTVISSASMGIYFIFQRIWYA
jgi:hypothetical protein